MTAFLLKRDGATIAGLTTQEASHTLPGTMSIAGRGCFTTKRDEHQALADLLTGRRDLYELSFEDGRQIQGFFRVSHLNRISDQLRDITITTHLPVKVLPA